MMNKKVQNYVLMESIGKGQYGNVYRAEHSISKQPFAVKVMSVDKFKMTPKLSQFTNNQINILTKISHPNIIKFIEMLRTNNNYYLVYEYCNGGTLAEYIKSKKRLPEEQSIKIFAQLRSAFQLLNREKILHRDLKPSNILFHNGVIKIADFGFCKELLATQLTQTMVGSPIYMAPEVLKGSVYDNRADIWSLGVILYQMLYGFCPYQQSTIGKLIGIIDNTLLKFAPDVSVSHHLQVLLKRMMTTKYRERISAQQLLRYPLDIRQSQSPLLSRSQRTINTMTSKQAMAFNRKLLTYIAETLLELVNKIQQDKSKYASSSFLVYKILWAIQKDLSKSSPYWQFIKLPNTDQQWDLILKNQILILQPFGPGIRQAVMNNGASLQMRMEMESSLTDFKYYLQLTNQYNNEIQIKNRLINVMLINRHYVLVLQKKTIDFTDYTESKKTLQQKQDLCKKFAYTRT